MTDEDKVEVVDYILENGKRCYWAKDCTEEAKYILFFPLTITEYGSNEPLSKALYCKVHMELVNRWARIGFDIETGEGCLLEKK